MLIDNLKVIPKLILDVMQPLHSLLLGEICTLDIRNHQAVSPVLEMLDEHLKSVLVSAFHCTREPVAGYFSAEGLRKLDIDFHQEWFIAEFGYKFDQAELLEIKEAWKSYYDKQQILGRDGMLWFCFMPKMVAHGCESFFRYAGGEAIYKAIGNPKIKAKLEGIGRPVVVQVCVPGRDVVSNQGLSIGLLNAYHRSVNPSATFCPVEGYLKRSVAAEEVVNVWERDDFFTYYQLPIEAQTLCCSL